MNIPATSRLPLPKTAGVLQSQRRSSDVTRDRSTNLWWVALLSWGEGWHNNHHGDQRAAAHGRRWFEIDMTYWMIRALSLVGLASDIVPSRSPMRTPSP